MKNNLKVLLALLLIFTSSIHLQNAMGTETTICVQGTCYQVLTMIKDGTTMVRECAICPWIPIKEFINKIEPQQHLAVNIMKKSGAFLGNSLLTGTQFCLNHYKLMGSLLLVSSVICLSRKLISPKMIADARLIIQECRTDVKQLRQKRKKDHIYTMQQLEAVGTQVADLSSQITSLDTMLAEQFKRMNTTTLSIVQRQTNQKQKVTALNNTMATLLVNMKERATNFNEKSNKTDKSLLDIQQILAQVNQALEQDKTALIQNLQAAGNRVKKDLTVEASDTRHVAG